MCKYKLNLITIGFALVFCTPKKDPDEILSLKNEIDGKFFSLGVRGGKDIVSIESTLTDSDLAKMNDATRKGHENYFRFKKAKNKLYVQKTDICQPSTEILAVKERLQKVKAKAELISIKKAINKIFNSEKKKRIDCLNTNSVEFGQALFEIAMLKNACGMKRRWKKSFHSKGKKHPPFYKVGILRNKSPLLESGVSKSKFQKDKKHKHKRGRLRRAKNIFVNLASSECQVVLQKIEMK